MLIGIGGRLRAGKDAAADYLVEKREFVKLNMSDPLARALEILNPQIPVTQQYSGGRQDLRLETIWMPYSSLLRDVGYVEAKKNPEVRRLLQKLGTEVGRDMIDENVWVDIASRSIDELADAGKHVVITGIRFPNELSLIGERDGLLLWISRPSEEGGEELLHASEQLTRADFEAEIINDGTLEELYAKVDGQVRDESGRYGIRTNPFW